MAKKSQIQEILAYLKAGNTLTTKEAFEYFGCSKLSTRISEFREKGYNIVDDWEESKTRYGRIARYKRYRLIEERT